jgi:hypothetical protein
MNRTLRRLLPAPAAVLLVVLTGCGASASTTRQSAAGGSNPGTLVFSPRSPAVTTALEVVSGGCEAGSADDFDGRHGAASIGPVETGGAHRPLENKANVDSLKAKGYCSQGCAFGGGGSWGYAPVDDAFYNPIRQVCAITENKNCTTE